MGIVSVGGVAIGGGALALVAGPCVIEDEEETVRTAAALARIAREARVGFVFKASFDKANRTSGESYRGRGLEEGLRVLQRVRDEIGAPVTTDVHLPEQAAVVAEVVDLLQVPAFLCRQTDLLLACAATGRPVNVKKGQFLAPDDCAAILAKLGPGRALLTERGTTFGYHDLVVDFRSLLVLRELGAPVVFDATHSVQRPGGRGDRSGGDRRFAASLGRAAVAVGVDALFAEVHPDPSRARSDADTQLPLDGFRDVLLGWVAVHEAARAHLES